MKKQPVFTYGNGNTLELNPLKKNAKLLRAFLHPLRQEFIKTIAKSKDKGCAVSVLCEKHNLPQVEVSRHLAILRQENLVTVTRDGKSRLYKPNYDQFALLGVLARTLQISQK